MKSHFSLTSKRENLREGHAASFFLVSSIATAR